MAVASLISFCKLTGTEGERLGGRGEGEGGKGGGGGGEREEKGEEKYTLLYHMVLIIYLTYTVCLL